MSNKQRDINSEAVMQRIDESVNDAVWGQIIPTEWNAFMKNAELDIDFRLKLESAMTWAIIQLQEAAWLDGYQCGRNPAILRKYT